ncbi:MAG: hypothetical protein WBG86_02310 [Polyangiales bacterium]
MLSALVASVFGSDAPVGAQPFGYERYAVFPGDAGSSLARGISDRCDVTGAIVDASGVSHGFLFDGRTGSLLDVEGPEGTVGTTSLSVNNRGQVMAVADLSDGGFAYFTWFRGTPTTVAIPGGAEFLFAGPFNERGSFPALAFESGFVNARAWLFSGASSDPLELRALPGFSNIGAVQVNNRGQIVGFAGNAADTIEHAVLWRNFRADPIDLGPISVDFDLLFLTDHGMIASAANGNGQQAGGLVCFWNANHRDPAATRKCYPGPEDSHEVRGLADTPGGGAMAVALAQDQEGKFLSFLMDQDGHVEVLSRPAGGQALAEGINRSLSVAGISIEANSDQTKAIVWIPAGQHHGPRCKPRQW